MPNKTNNAAAAAPLYEPTTRELDALAAVNYEFFVQYVNEGYKHGKHTRYLARKLQEIEAKHAAGEPTFTIINLPPGHSKSETITKTFPVWFIGKDKKREVMELSYGQGLAREFGLANMEKIEKHGGRIFDIELDKRLSAAATWKLKGSGGGMVSRSFGGDVTGRRADILIIDDPIKNRSQANSPAYRENIWKEWRSTVQTRLRPGASIILVLTRWHEDDLAGRIMEHDGRDWEVISLPAIAKEGDLLGREPGQALWSEYGYDEKYLEMIKKSVGPLDFASLYQQDPQPQEGTLIKRHYFQYYATAPRMESYERVILSWDLTFKDAETSDYVVGQAWGKIGPNFYLIDETRARMDILETIGAIKNMRARYKRASGIYIEDKANGPAVITMLKKQISGIVPVNPVGGKVERVQAMLPLFAAGNVFLPSAELYPDIDDFVHELAGFPFASNDDRVDATTQALKELSEGAEIFIGR